MSGGRSGKKRQSNLLRVVIVVAVLAIGGIAAWLFTKEGSIDPAQLMVRATQHYEAGDLQASAIDLKAVITEQPDNGDARFLLGRIYLDVGNPQGALKELERARSLGINAPEVALGITRSLLLTGKFDEAATEIAVTGDSSNPEWLVLRGLLDLAQQRLDDARTTFQSILEQHPDHKEARRGLMQAELAAGNADLARAEVERLLASDESDAGLWIIRGELDIYDGNAEAARDAFLKAVELEPNNPLARLAVARALVELGEMEQATNHLDKIGRDGEEDPRVNFLRAKIADSRGDVNSALMALRKVLQMAPMDRESLVMAARLHFGRGEFTRAQDFVGRLLEVEPGNAAAQRMMGAIQLAAGRTDGLGAIVENSLESGSAEDPGMLALLGTAYLKHGKFEDSAASLERAAELAPDSLPIRTQLALSRLSAGEPEQAVSELREIIGEDPDFVQAYIMLTLVHLSASDNAAALKSAEELRARHPDNALAHNVVGYVQEVSDNAAAAGEAYKKALEKDPAFHPANINLARLAISAGDTAGGRKQFQNVLDQEPFHAFALMGMAALALQDDDLDEAERLWLLAREHNPDAVAPRLLLAKHYRARDNASLAQTVIKEAYRLAPYALQVQGEYAAIMLEAKEYEEALSAANQLVERVPDSLPGLELLARIHNQLGNEEGLTGTLERIAEIAPDAAGARVLLGRLAIRREDFKEAGNIAAALVSDDASLGQGRELEGDVLLAQQDFAAARVAYAEALEKAPSTSTVLKLDQVERKLGVDDDRLGRWLEEHPDDLQVRLVRASYMHQEGSGQDAIPEYERMLKAQGSNPIVLNNLAWLYHESGDERAVDLARRAHELAPQSPEIMDTYGWILFEDGKHEQGFDLLSKALEAAPDNPDIGYHAASALHATGQTSKARRALKTLLEKHESFPTREDAESLLAKMNGG